MIGEELMKEGNEEVPMTFYMLETFEPDNMKKLEKGTHLFGVYGDNWFQSCKYTIQALVGEKDILPIFAIQNNEKRIMEKKKELEGFQEEFMELKKKFEAACERLEKDTKDTVELLKERDANYEEYISQISEKYRNNPALQTVKDDSSSGLFGLFGKLTK